jgi:phosphatidylglycerophosphatase A
VVNVRIAPDFLIPYRGISHRFIEGEILDGPQADALSRWIFWIATGFGTGKTPVAPGTAGSLVGLVVVFLLTPFSPFVYLSIFLFIFAAGWYSAGRMEQALGRKDDSAIVIDEMVGMLIAGFLIPQGIGFLLLAFVIFRFFDVLKPFPARWIDKHMTGANGIMLDDVVAGIYANLILQGIGRVVS